MRGLTVAVGEEGGGDPRRKKQGKEREARTKCSHTRSLGKGTDSHWLGARLMIKVTSCDRRMTYRTRHKSSSEEV